MSNIKRINDTVIEDAMRDLLRDAAVRGETLESLITDVFAEAHTDEPGPVLSQFALLLLTNLNLKKFVAGTLLKSLHAAALAHRDIYDQVDYLTKPKRRSVRVIAH